MRASGRRRFFRHVAALLVTAQAVAYALAPIAEARTAHTPEAVSHIEASHSAACVIVHRPDTCIACQMLSMRAGEPKGDATLLPAGALRTIPCETSAGLALRAGVDRSHNSRAPPAVTT